MPPKKPGSPFVFYVAKVRADSPKAETTKEGAEIMVKAGEQWRALSDAEKAVRQSVPASTTDLF